MGAIRKRVCRCGVVLMSTEAMIKHVRTVHPNQRYRKRNIKFRLKQLQKGKVVCIT